MFAVKLASYLANRPWPRLAQGLRLAHLGLFYCSLACFSRPLEAATFTVNSLVDDTAAADVMPGDGICADAFNACTLRAAILEANAFSGADEVRFSVAGVWQANASNGALPTIIETLNVTGFGAPGHTGGLSDIAAHPPVVVLDGAALSGSADGLRFFGAAAASSRVGALSIINFPDNGIEIGLDANEVFIEGCFIGLDLAQSARGNRNGISIVNSGGHNIGSIYISGSQSFLGLPNVISGNDEAGVIGTSALNVRLLQNIIGANAELTLMRPNGTVGVRVSGNGTRMGVLDLNNNELGGNIIVGNQGNGLELIGNDVLVVGNFIGQTPAGVAMANNGQGLVTSGSGAQIGANGSSGRNVIANNFNGIVLGVNGGAPANAAQVVNNVIGSAEGGNLGTGIALVNGNNGVIQGNQILNNQSGGILLSNGSHQVLGNQLGTRFQGGQWQVHGNQGFSLRLENNTNNCRIGDPANPNVVGFTLPFGAQADALLIAGTEHIINSNYIGIAPDGSNISNAGDGMDLNGSLFQVLNNLSGNNGTGLRLAGTSHLVRGNQLGTDLYGRDQGNATSAMIVDGSNHTIEQNRMAWNNQYGIEIASGNNFVIESNLIANNGLSGIDANAVVDLSISSNQIFRNRNGILLTGSSLRNAFFANQFYENTVLDIDLDGDGSNVNDATDSDEGPNRLMNYADVNNLVINGAGGNSPVMSLQLRVDTSNLNANFPLSISLYWSDWDEPDAARYYLTSLAYTTPFGIMNTNVNLPPGSTGGRISTIACDNLDNCSEYSPAFPFGMANVVFSDSLESL